MSTAPTAETLRRLQFKNSGLVRRDMRFEYRNRTTFYIESVDTWRTLNTTFPYGKELFFDGQYSYLHEIRDGEAVAPPSGMRSAVPLGGLGAGTVELRADGSLRDWNIFNNSPAGGGEKVQLDDALFSLRVAIDDGPARTWTLRTHPPRFLPGVAQIEYAGAYPVSRLRFSDPDLPIGVTLYAYSEFRLRDADRSATPAILFSFALENPTDRTVDMSLMFTLPNHIGGAFSEADGLALKRPGREPLSGSMAVRAAGDAAAPSTQIGHSLFQLHEDFAKAGEFAPTRRVPEHERETVNNYGQRPVPSPGSAYGAVALRSTLAPGATALNTFALAWHFPHKPFGDEIVGNHYTTLYRDATDAAEAVLGRLAETWRGLHEWQQLCFGNTLPEWLQDAMVNSVGAIAKTGIWAGDGRWRQWESFSCSQVDPIDVYFYRSLPYQWFFPALGRSTVTAYAADLNADGSTKANLGRPNSRLDVFSPPIAEPKGDSATLLILSIYRDYLWTADRTFLDALWPAAKRTAQWQIDRCARYGLPDRLVNTYDLWDLELGVESIPDLISYNAFLHLAAMRAAERLADIQGDPDFAARCRENAGRAREALVRRLWTGEHFRHFWSANGNTRDAPHSDALYGQLWAGILGLGLLAEPEMMRSHLAAERRINGSPYGLVLVDDPALGRMADVMFEVGSLDWCALNLGLGGDLDASLAEGEKIYRKWRDQLRDQWDIRDATTSSDGAPWCNSHYSRQLILWAIPLALSGQQYSAAQGALSFDPRVPAPAVLPFMTPAAHGTLELSGDGRCMLTVLSGELALHEPVRIRSDGREVVVRRGPGAGRTTGGVL